MVRAPLAILALVLLAGCSGSSDEAERTEAIDTPEVEDAVLDVSKTPTPGGPVPIPYPNGGTRVW